MLARSAVVVVVDRLGAGALGAYGNTWLDTPAFNRLASQSVLCEAVLADSPKLTETYRAYWTGRHLLEPLAATSLPARLAARAITTVLVTDEPQVADHPLAARFAQIVRISPVAAERCAEDPAETSLAGLFAAAAETWAALSPPYLLWIHSRGMDGPWDAPLAFREQFRDEEDPLPGDSAVRPEMRVEPGCDPDEILKVVHSYAGQVLLLDRQMGAVLELLASHGGDESLLAVTSPRGYPLAEHGRVGPCDEALYGELLHVPLLVRFPGQQGALLRTPHILQPADLGTAVAAHFELPAEMPSTLWQIARNEEQRPREIAVAVGASQRAIRTPAWYLRQSASDDQLRLELFAKPDDRWEVNEVASRCPDEVEAIVAAGERFEQGAREGRLAELAPLPELLRSMWR